MDLDPKELQLLSQQAPVRFNPGSLVGKNMPAEAGYQVFLSGYAAVMLEQERSYAEAVELMRSLDRLRSQPRPVLDGYVQRGAVDTRAVTTRNYKIEYRINSGQVLVYNIAPLDSVQRARDRREKAAMYVIKKNSQGIWKLERKVDNVRTEYAAVNGQSNNITKATWLMGRHLAHRYSGVTEYTLFHNPSVGGLGDTWESMRDKLGFTTPVTRRFASVLQDVQENGGSVKWVAHSQGGVIFTEAVRYHLNGNSSWALLGGFNGAFGKSDGRSLDKHTVAFHAGANNQRRSDLLFKRAKVGVVGYFSHPYDFVPQLIGMNAMGPWSVVGSLVYANHVFSGSTEQSPHTLPYQGFGHWNTMMKKGSGKGRGVAQKAFHAVDAAARKAGKDYIPNHLR